MVYRGGVDMKVMPKLPTEEAIQFDEFKWVLNHSIFPMVKPDRHCKKSLV